MRKDTRKEEGGRRKERREERGEEEEQTDLQCTEPSCCFVVITKQVLSTIKDKNIEQQPRRLSLASTAIDSLNDKVSTIMLSSAKNPARINLSPTPM